MKSNFNTTEPQVYRGFAFNLYDDLKPLYRLNPFTNEQAEVLRLGPAGEGTDALLSQHFYGRPFVYTTNGRQAIREAMRLLDLAPEDCVTIFTSSENFYISGCVTTEIQAFCKWSRRMEPNTKALFINHEFGVPHPRLVELKQLGLPIIEDCCYAFHSGTSDNGVGQVGDYVLYSFAKYFPVQFGGVLVGNYSTALPNNLLDAAAVDYLRQVVGQLYPQADAIATQRRANHEALAARLAPLGVAPRFDFAAGGVPGVFLFTAPTAWPLPALKAYLWECGIHCSVFYGEQAFFIPVHQGLSVGAFEYFAACLEHFMTKNSLNA